MRSLGEISSVVMVPFAAKSIANFRRCDWNLISAKMACCRCSSSDICVKRSNDSNLAFEGASFAN